MDLPALDRAIGESQRVLLDSSALIAYLTSLEVVHPLMVHVMRRIERSDDALTGCYSAVSAAELLVAPFRSGLPETAAIQGFLTSFPSLSLVAIDFGVAARAAQLRARANLRLPDALIVSCGLTSGCEAIVSNDAEWHRRLAPLLPQARWIYLGDYLA